MRAGDRDQRRENSELTFRTLSGHRGHHPYGVEITISSILNIVLVILIGIVTNAILESILFLVVFMYIRVFTGGYHADSYFRCNLLMCTSFIIVCFLARFICAVINVIYIISIFAVIMFTVIVFCPIENENKPIHAEKRLGLKSKGLISCAVFSAISIIGIDRFPIYRSTIMLSVRSMVNCSIALQQHIQPKVMHHKFFQYSHQFDAIQSTLYNLQQVLQRLLYLQLLYGFCLKSHNRQI